MIFREEIPEPVRPLPSPLQEEPSIIGEDISKKGKVHENL